MRREKRLVVTSVRMDDRLSAALKQLAEADSRPVSNYIELVLRKHVLAQGVDLDAIEVPPRKDTKAKKPAKGRKP